MKRLATLEVQSRRAWRAWLRTHHAGTTEVWLVFFKPHAARTGIAYEDAVEEALCYGWVDSLVRRLDDHRYARKFTPRKPNSRWSTSNRRRYASLAERGLLAAPGRARGPTDRDGDAPRVPDTRVPAYIQRALKAEPRAAEAFRALAPSHRRQYLGWIDSAKRPETRERRLREAIALLARGRKLGLK